MLVTKQNKTEPKHSSTTFQRNGEVSGAEQEPPLRSGQAVKLRTGRAVGFGAQQILSSSLRSYLRASSLFHFLQPPKRDTNTNTAALLGELNTAGVGCWAQRLEGKSRPKWWPFLTPPEVALRRDSAHKGGPSAWRDADTLVEQKLPECHVVRLYSKQPLMSRCSSGEL